MNMKGELRMLFAKPGEENSHETVRLAVEYAREAGVKHIVVASYSGATAGLLAPYTSEFNIVVVGQVYGFRGDGATNPMTPEVRRKLEGAGMKVYMGTHVLSGAERGLSNRFQGVYPVEIVAHTLRMFSQGVKVGVEISVMALDAGLIPHGQPVVAIGGSRRGADTAILIQPAHAQRLLDTKVIDVICKPKPAH